MASNSKDDVVIIKVENGRVIKRTNSTSDTVSQTQPRKKRKLLTSLPSSDDVLVVDGGTSEGTRTNPSDKRKSESDNKKRIELNDTQPLVTETIRAEEVYTEDDIIEQQMLDHALALSLQQEEMERLSRNISNDREYPISKNTSLSSRDSPLYSNSLMTSVSHSVCNDGSSLSSVTPSADQLPFHNFTDKEFELPMYWQPMPENCPKNYELFMVLPGTEEYNVVTQNFVCQPLSVYSVKRIQNLEFLKRYTYEKKLILSIRGKDFNLNEQRLFHTSSANPDDICEQGLDNRLSRSGSFGAGIYFSDDVLKCHSYWRHSFQPALMFQCRVILGDIKEYPRGVGDTSLKREPEKVGRNPGKQRMWYDSVKGNITGRNEFVVYNAYRVMPEYMIEYTFTKTTTTTTSQQFSLWPQPMPANSFTPPRYAKQKKGRSQRSKK